MSTNVAQFLAAEHPTAFSFEVLPPVRGKSIEQVYKTIDRLMPFNPAYINITTHRSEVVYREVADGVFQRSFERKRPGTVAIAANSFAVTAEGLCYMPGYGVGAAATAVVGRSVGAGDVKLAKRYGNICTAMGGIFMGITGLFMFIVCPVVFRFLTPDPAVRELATQVLRI
mgnify:CR=1 FL=1